MGATPELRSPQTSPRGLPRASDIPRCCRRYAVRPGAAGSREDAARMIDALRYLEERLERWTVARLEAAALSDSGPPRETVVPLALLVRHFASWLDAHPERTNEPVDWLIVEALEDCLPALRPHPPGAPLREA